MEGIAPGCRGRVNLGVEMLCARVVLKLIHKLETLCSYNELHPVFVVTCHISHFVTVTFCDGRTYSRLGFSFSTGRPPSLMICAAYTVVLPTANGSDIRLRWQHLIAAAMRSRSG